MRPETPWDICVAEIIDISFIYVAIPRNTNGNLYGTITIISGLGFCKDNGILNVETEPLDSSSFVL